MTWWSLAWTASPLWLAVNALAAYRLTRLWVADMLPPLPRLRDAMERWADQRMDRELRAALQADREDPEWQAEADAAGRRALAGGYNAPGVVGVRERIVTRKHRLRGDRHPVAYLATCAWCSGYWISLAVFLLATLFPVAVWAFFAVPLAFSAVVGLLHQATE